MPNRRTQVSRLQAEITNVTGEVEAISRILNNELEQNFEAPESQLIQLILHLANAVKELAEKQAELLNLVDRDYQTIKNSLYPPVILLAYPFGMIQNIHTG